MCRNFDFDPAGAKDQGSALIAVVWAVFLLSLFAVGIMLATLNSRKTLQSVEIADADTRIASSALRLFFKEHFYNGEEKASRVDTVSVFGNEVEVRVSFESGQINLNRASRPLLAALFIVAGQSEDEALSLADAITDWRDRDSVPAARGAEVDEYYDIGRAVGPRNGPFESVGELRYVRGMDASLLSCVTPLLTVASLSAEVDLRFADSPVRSVIQWAYDNEWEDVPWANPEETEAAPGAIVDTNEIGGQALDVTMIIEGDQTRQFNTRVRFKSVSDMSYAMLSPIARIGTESSFAECPFDT